MSAQTDSTVKEVTLQQVGFTLATGVATLAVILFLFAVAVRLRCTNIAPRCEARPREVIYNPNLLAEPSQKRGNPFFLGWVFWVLGLSYDQLLSGVEGTGTRRGGMKGELLKVNLDHILLLRFNALCLKISVVAMLVYCTVCLPIYFYARCRNVPLGEFDIADYPTCNATLSNNTRFSSYSRFTLANIPSLTDEVLTTDYHIASFQMYCVSLATWLVCWFACFELFHEWIDLLAMRRVYYLEYDMWKGRKAELKATMLSDVDGISKSGRSHDEIIHEEKHLFERDAWIPHPEQRDTPPNIELYSVLVGGLPTKPQDAVLPEDLEAALQADDNETDWQMGIVSTFFDSCVPNQPGYSSSVAAVTILPSATELASAWKHWYIASKHLSRLRFIRHRIIELGHKPNGQKLVDDIPDKRSERSSDREGKKRQRDDDVFDSQRRKDYTAEILGAGVEDDINDEFWKSLDLGPEQIAQYNLEFSKGLAGCCPHGFCEERISWCKDIETLYEMETEAADLVRESYVALKVAGEIAMQHKQRQGFLHGKLKLEDLIVEKTDMLEKNHSHHHTERRLLEKRIHQSKQSQLLNSSAKPLSRPTLERQDSDDASFKTAASHMIESSRGGLSRGFESGLLRRASVRSNLRSGISGQVANETENLWEDVERIASESKNLHRGDAAIKYKVSHGKWALPTFGRGWRGLRKKVASLLVWTQDNSNEVTDVMARDTQYAAVTFTSRQAAIAARKCLADGRGAKRFRVLENIPVPPLADSAAFNICDCRGFTRPVTIGLNDHQKNWRKTAATVAIISIYLFYTFPITWASKYGSEALIKLFPGLPEWGPLSEGDQTVKGFLDAQILTLFLSLLPDVFLWISNFGSGATSMVASENAALHYFWWFMVLFAIIGSSIARMVLDVYEHGSVNLYTNMNKISQTIPVEVSSTWLNWIILKTTIFHPLFYLLQGSTWLAAIARQKCLVRVFRGGGSGNRLPYRIYVEGATVILCCLAFAPQAPILSPFAVLFFVACTPLKRWVVIFTYKPPFDSGGSRWPFLFDMILTSIVVAQILLCGIMTFKHAYGPAIFALLPLFPVFMFRRQIHDRFLDAYMDAALLQTSMLDGWDVGPDSEHLSLRGREDFRQFLVDAHKASYVPVCIAAVNANVDIGITAEPAVVQPSPNDVPEPSPCAGTVRSATIRGKEVAVRDRRGMLLHGHTQFGAINRRHLVSFDNTSDMLLDHHQTHRSHEESYLSQDAPDELDPLVSPPFAAAATDSDGTTNNTRDAGLNGEAPRNGEPAVRVSALGTLRAKPADGETGEIEYVFTFQDDEKSQEKDLQSQEHHA
ncbi:CSC1-like protein [Seminavis robusta]|uniref:CSC1-like protein n=1 Tax=Seminavis robusta TaxID=568900 RepID=A0A9N8D852_9STRA|nr:CSC1-like protein [Seminavis robusta]|eukprot:Sro12_g009390.1 CSC1-like protein (1326) ;mRNA; r:108836-114306